MNWDDDGGGAGRSGWRHEGDPFNGEWKSAHTVLEADEQVWSYTFAPINDKEFPELGELAATYRRTLKLRIASDLALPEISQMELFGDSVWGLSELVVEWDGEGMETGVVEVYDGLLDRLEPIGDSAGVLIDAASWSKQIGGQTGGVQAKVWSVANQSPSCQDRTIVTVRAGAKSFSVLVSDLNNDGPLFIKDFEVLVSLAEHRASISEFKDYSRGGGETTYYDRIFDEEEQTLGRAWGDMPAKTPFYFVVGAEGRRQRFGVEPDGRVFRGDRDRGFKCERALGRDSQRLTDDPARLTWDLGLPGSPPTGRVPLNGYLPIVTTRWEAEGVRYEQIAFAFCVDDPAFESPIRGDDLVAAMVRVEMVNLSDSPRTMSLTIATFDDDNHESLGVDASSGDVAMLHNEVGLLRAVAEEYGEVRLDCQNGKIVCDALIEPGARQSVILKLPFLSPTDKELTNLLATRYDTALSSTISCWERRIADGAQIDTPEPLINDFYRAHLTHLLINHERHPASPSDHPCDIARVGSFSYAAYANESIMQITDLARRGYFSPAASGLETFLKYQGTVALPGDFDSKEGVFYGAGGYECGDYNQHHGWVLWGLGEFFFNSRDVEWLERASANIVSGCNWIVSQRRRTMCTGADGNRVLEYGFLPAGVLEDISDYRYWLSTNVFTWWGMDRAVNALKEINHPEAERLMTETESFKKDLVAGFTEAMVRSSVVRLRDGSAVPHVPAHQHQNGRSYGWIRETLEGAIHLLRCGVVEPDSQLGTWIMKDYEDNLYISDQFGYTLEDEPKHWFSRGGFSMQPNLLCGPIPYLQRDEIKHFLRAYFNSFAVGVHSDTRMMTEHPLPQMGDWMGDHIKTSDESNSTYWLRLMFVYERNDELLLGFGIPRYWLAHGEAVSIKRAQTYFGEMSLEIESRADEGKIVARISPPTRNPPEKMLLRFRHATGKKLTGVEIDGTKWTDFDPESETVALPQMTVPTDVMALY